MIYVVVWFLFGIVAAILGSNRGGSGPGWFVGGMLLVSPPVSSLTKASV